MGEFQVCATTDDGVDLTFAAAPGTALLDAAAQAGHTLVSLCRKGTCGVCRVRLVSGSVDLGSHTPDALSAVDEAAGLTLACCATPLSDVEIALPYERSRVLDGAVPQRRAAITELDRWPGDVVRVVVQVIPDEFGAALQFDAGQFAELTPPGQTETRAYSFANTGNWDGRGEFYIKLRTGGYFSEYLRTLAAVGDELTLTGPQGAFTLRESGMRPRWMVCGGTGLAPLISMLRRMSEWGELMPAKLILGVNTPAEVFAQAEIAELAASMPLTWSVPVVMPDAAWAGPVGNAVEELVTSLDSLGPGAEKPDIYLCGSPGFLNAATAAAIGRGVPEDQVHMERILPN